MFLLKKLNTLYVIYPKIYKSIIKDSALINRICFVILHSSWNAFWSKYGRQEENRETKDF